MAKRNKLLKREKKAQLRAQKSQSLPKSELESESPSPKNKTWKRVGVFDKYEDALAHKTKVLSGAEDASELEVKIKRCGSEGSQFQVKLWTAPSLRINKKRKKEKAV